MLSLFRLTLTFAGAALLSTAAFAQPRYSITEIVPPAGAISTTARGLNDIGQVVGSFASGSSQTDTAFVWQAGTLRSLGKLPKGNNSDAMAVNAAGVVVGDGDTGDFRPQAWVNTASGLYNFFPNNGGNTHAIAINAAGTICGYYTKSLSGNTASWRGAIWTIDPKDPRKYKTTDLPSIPGLATAGTNAIPWSFNNAGEAAGWAANDVIGQHAVLWHNDAAHTILDLGTYPNDWSSIAWGINDAGQVVGESHPPGSTRAVIWQNDAAHTAVELPKLPGDTDASASAINTGGVIIGSSSNSSGSSAVVWVNGNVYDLESLIDPAAATGWSISIAYAINTQGQIVGTGMYNGVTRGFLLTPIAP